MSFLSDRAIRQELKLGNLIIEPLDEDAIQPASVDIRLGKSIKLIEWGVSLVDPRQLPENYAYPAPWDWLDKPFYLPGGQYILATTLERVIIPEYLIARVEGRSSRARIGLSVHQTSGFIDPGFQGQITLEIHNLNKVPVKLYYGMGIAQLSLGYLDQPCEYPYGHPKLNSHYQNQQGATAARQ